MDTHIELKENHWIPSWIIPAEISTHLAGPYTTFSQQSGPVGQNTRTRTLQHLITPLCIVNLTITQSVGVFRVPKHEWRIPTGWTSRRSQMCSPGADRGGSDPQKTCFE